MFEERCLGLRPTSVTALRKRQSLLVTVDERSAQTAVSARRSVDIEQRRKSWTAMSDMLWIAMR